MIRNKESCVILITLLLLVSFFPLTYADQPLTIPEVKLKSKQVLQNKTATQIGNTTFNATQIKKSPVVNLSQFLKQQQSVVRLANSSGDNSQTALSVRGFGDNAAANSLILIDGFPLINPSLLAPNFNSIPLTDILSIDIFPGSEGALWGNQAVGGVVNIITKHPKTFFSNSILSAGSYHSFYGNTLLGDKLSDGLFYKVFALAGTTDNFRQHNSQSGNNLALTIGRDYAEGTLSFNLQSYSNSIDFPGGLSKEQFEHHPEEATEFNNFSRYRTDQLQVLNEEQLNTWLLETRLAYYETNGDGFVYADFTRNDTLADINPRLIGSVFGSQVIFGYYGQLSHYRLSNTAFSEKASANESDVYFQTIIPFYSHWDLTLGARKAWEWNQIAATNMATPLYQVFVNEEGLTYHWNDALSFFMRRDENFSFPKANEETWVPTTETFLKPQTGVSYEAGTKAQYESYQWQMNVYHLQLKNEIAFNPEQEADQPFGSFNNLDKTVRDGIGLSAVYYFNTKTTLNGQFNYVRARFARGPFAGNVIPAVPAINSNLGLNYAFTSHWQTQYNLLYVSSEVASEDVTNVGRRVAAYWVHNIALQYFIQALIFNFEIDNIFNQHYANYVFYNALTQQNVFYPAPGRNFLLTAKINID